MFPFYADERTMFLNNCKIHLKYLKTCYPNTTKCFKTLPQGTHFFAFFLSYFEFLNVK